MPEPSAPPVLDYHSAGTRPHRPVPRDRGVLLFAACLCGLIAVGLLGGLIDLLIVTWPNFGVTLLAGPVFLGVLAFGTVSWASLRALAGNDTPPAATAGRSSPAAPGRLPQI